MFVSALLVAAALSASPEPPVAAPDTFEIALMNRNVPGATPVPVLLDADELDFIQWSTVVLRRGGDAVAAFQAHQVSLVINRSAGGSRTFELISAQGENLEFRADRMVPQQHNVVLFYTGDRLVGVSTQNGAVMVIDKGARIGPR